MQRVDGAYLKSHLQMLSGSEPHRSRGSEGFGGTVGKAWQSVCLSPSEGLNGQGAWAFFSCVRGVKEKVVLFLQLERSSGAPPAPVPLYIRYCSSLPASKTARE